MKKVRVKVSITPEKDPELEDRVRDFLEGEGFNLTSKFYLNDYTHLSFEETVKRAREKLRF